MPVVDPIVRNGPPLPGRQLMHQQWRDVSFVHWSVDPARIAPLLPTGVVPDLYDGAAWVGLVPFRMVGAGPLRLLSVPWLGSFAETNVRTYGVDRTGRRGVVFLSLDASRLAVVLGARAVFGLPYLWARMSVTSSSGTVRYHSRRRWPGPVGTGGTIVIRPGPRLPTPGPLDDFLTARWGLHAQRGDRVRYIPNQHRSWPLHTAQLTSLDDSLFAAAGFADLAATPPDSVLYSPGVGVRFAFPRPVGR